MCECCTRHRKEPGLNVRGFSGEYGMGTQANELSLGCDCLGTIHYLVSPAKYEAI